MRLRRREVSSRIRHDHRSAHPATAPERFERAQLAPGDCSLVDGVRRLAREGRAFAVDIPAQAWWHDVDTLADLRLAEISVSHGLATVFS
jgi:hypothetical protein